MGAPARNGGENRRSDSVNALNVDGGWGGRAKRRNSKTLSITHSTQLAIERAPITERCAALRLEN